MSDLIEFRCCTVRRLNPSRVTRATTPVCVECSERMMLSELPPGPWLLVCVQDDYVVPKDMTVLCLGEIQNMKGHYVIQEKGGKTHWGLHLESFGLAE